MKTSEKVSLLNELLAVLQKKLKKEQTKLNLIKISVDRHLQTKQEQLVAVLHKKIANTQQWINHLRAMHEKTYEGTIEQLLTEVNNAIYSGVFVDREYFNLPICLYDDFREFIIGKTISSVNEKAMLLPLGVKEYYHKIVYAGIDYSIHFSTKKDN